jgi:hypothetical protein
VLLRGGRRAEIEISYSSVGLNTRVLLRLEMSLEGRATSQRGYAGETVGTRLEGGATMGCIANDKDKQLPTTDQAGTEESGELVAEVVYHAEKGVRSA